MKIKVLHFAGVINRFDFIDTVLTELDRREFEIRAITVTEPRNRIGKYSEEEVYPSICLSLPSIRGNWLKCYKALAEEIRKFKPDILHTHHFDESILGALMVKFGIVPRLVIGHHYSDHIYVLTKGLKRKIFLEIERWCNSKAARTIVPTEEVRNLLLKQGENERRVVTIPYGVDPNLKCLVSNENVERLKIKYNLKDKFVVVTSCRLNREKGLEFLLRAIPDVIRVVPNLRLMMAGDGPMMGELKDLVKILDISQYVTFLGWRADALDWMSLADCIVQPSLAESFCQVITESLILERPVIATPVGIAPEVIVSGKRGGILVPIGNHAEIAKAIVKLAENADFRKMLGKTGKEFVASAFSLREVAAKYERVYREIYQTNSKI